LNRSSTEDRALELYDVVQRMPADYCFCSCGIFVGFDPDTEQAIVFIGSGKIHVDPDKLIVVGKAKWTPGGTPVEII